MLNVHGDLVIIMGCIVSDFMFWVIWNSWTLYFLKWLFSYFT